MGEKYLQDNEKEALKGKLYAYLQDKAKRRAGVTSSGAYDQAQEAFGKQKALYDVGAFTGGLSEAASMAGTLGGKRAQSDIVPKFNQAMYDSTQGAIDNTAKLRGIEESSNMNDLAIARYLAGISEHDDTKKLKEQELGIRQQEAGNTRDQQLMILRENLADKAAARKDALEREAVKGFYKGKAGTGDQGDLQSRRLEETIRHNKALEGRPGAAGAKDRWDLVGPDENGVQWERNPVTGEVRQSKLPLGFKPKGKGEDKPATADERKAGMQAEIAIKELPVLEQLEQSYHPGARDAIAGTVGGPLGNYGMTDQGRAYDSAARRILDPLLRSTTGANAPQSEIDNMRKGYIILPGDDPATIERKKVARRKFIQSLHRSAGRGQQSQGLPPPPGGAGGGKDPQIEAMAKQSGITYEQAAAIVAKRKAAQGAK